MWSHIKGELWGQLGLTRPDAVAICRETGDRHREGRALTNIEMARAAQKARTSFCSSSARNREASRHYLSLTTARLGGLAAPGTVRWPTSRSDTAARATVMFDA